MTNLMNTPGTIACVFIRRRGEIKKGMSDPGNFYLIKNKMIEVLDDPELAKNPAVPEAKKIIGKARNFNQLCSIYATYLTGMKVS